MRALFKKELYIRFAEEPRAFIYTVKGGGLTVKSERVLISIPLPQSAGRDGPLDKPSNALAYRLRKPTPANSDRVG